MVLGQGKASLSHVSVIKASQQLYGVVALARRQTASCAREGRERGGLQERTHIYKRFAVEYSQVVHLKPITKLNKCWLDSPMSGCWGLHE